MLCQDCGKHEASIHFTQLVNGEKVELKVCKECAAKKGFQSALGTVENIVSKMVSDTEAQKESNDLVCGNCSTSYSQFQNTGRLGCSNCYRVFEERLHDLLRKIHGNVQHVGKVPALKQQEVYEHKHLEELREQLRLAIKAEQFEEAALLRDEIKKIERTDNERH